MIQVENMSGHRHDTWAYLLSLKSEDIFPHLRDLFDDASTTAYLYSVK
jgi:hypothetical protein